MAKKQTSAKVSSIAGRYLARGRPSWMPVYFWRAVFKPIAGSVLSQDETKGQKRAKRNG